MSISRQRGGVRVQELEAWGWRKAEESPGQNVASPQVKGSPRPSPSIWWQKHKSKRDLMNSHTIATASGRISCTHGVPGRRDLRGLNRDAASCLSQLLLTFSKIILMPVLATVDQRRDYCFCLWKQLISLKKVWFLSVLPSLNYTTSCLSLHCVGPWSFFLFLSSPFSWSCQGITTIISAWSRIPLHVLPPLSV